MITPQEIRAKARRLYAQAIAAWLAGKTEYFPHRIPADLKLSPDLAVAVREVQTLSKNSKASKGFGYTVKFEQRKMRVHGENLRPQSLWIDTLDDLLRLLGKVQEFRQLEAGLALIRTRLPSLSQWTTRKWKKLLNLGDELPDLVRVVEYLREHPRPNCYLRELPVAVPTKLIEQNMPLLAEWLDLTLPKEAINFDCEPREFERRYGFRIPHEHFPIRLLDESLLSELRCPAREFSLPLEAIANLPVRDARLLIVENKTTFWSLPDIPRGIALWGQGNAVTRLFDIPWFEHVQFQYWGDLDVEGLAILARIRRRFPSVESVMMDYETLVRFMKPNLKGNQQPQDCSPDDILSVEEARAFAECRDKCCRVEQEHIPQDYVFNVLLSGRRANSVSAAR